MVDYSSTLIGLVCRRLIDLIDIYVMPFDGNFYVTEFDHQPKKGEEIDSSLYPEVTYENSPVLIEE